MLALKWIRKCPRTNCLNHFSKVTLVHWVFCKYTQRVYLVFSEIFFPHTFFKIKALTREEEKLGHPQKFFFFFFTVFTLHTNWKLFLSLFLFYSTLSLFLWGLFILFTKSRGERARVFCSEVQSFFFLGTVLFTEFGIRESSILYYYLTGQPRSRQNVHLAFIPIGTNLKRKKYQ